jgi:hypothetical protein
MNGAWLGMFAAAAVLAQLLNFTVFLRFTPPKWLVGVLATLVLLGSGYWLATTAAVTIRMYENLSRTARGLPELNSPLVPSIDFFGTLLTTTVFVLCLRRRSLLDKRPVPVAKERLFGCFWSAALLGLLVVVCTVAVAVLNVVAMANGLRLFDGRSGTDGLAGLVGAVLVWAAIAVWRRRRRLRRESQGP